jgi:uncharacterized protein YneF (UPF0154 family)
MNKPAAAKRDLKRAPINRYLALTVWIVVLVMALGVGAVLARPEIFGQLQHNDPAHGLGNLTADMGAVALLSIVAGLAVGVLFIARRRMERLETERIYRISD